MLVDLFRGEIELVEDPTLSETLLARGLCRALAFESTESTVPAYLGVWLGYEGFVQLQHSELRGVEDLVAKFAVTFDNLDVQVDVTTYPKVTVREWRHNFRMLELLTKGLVSTQGKPQGIGTTLRKAF